MRPWRADLSLPRRRTPWRLTLTLMLTLLALTALSTAVAAEACLNASTLFRGATDRDAIAYSDDCVARGFRVVDGPGPMVSLNLSHLNLVRVRDYPPVNSLMLHDNYLTTFQTPITESLMENLDLHDNLIADLSSLRLPRRLSKLNLASNRINSLSSSVPWPAALELKWLSLEGNHMNSIAADAFATLTTLTYLSLANTTLENLGDLSFPITLNTLNLSQNLFKADTLVFASTPVALQTLDLSGNNFSTFPDLAAFSSLVDLNLAGNAITSLSGVRLPPKLKKLNLSANTLATIEIAQSDFTIFQSLDELTLAVDALSATCTNDKATQQVVRVGLTVCVLSDELVVKPKPKSPATDGQVTTAAPPAPPHSSGDTNSTTDTSATNTHMSNKAMLLIAGGCFTLGLIVVVYVFLVRSDGRAINGKPSGHPTLAPDASEASSRTFGRHGRDTGDYSNASWVFGSPMKDVVGPHNVVAILEDDHRRRGRGRSKVEDLLVYEIPMDEIVIKEPMVQKQRNDEAMYMAEYQGFQVVMHTLAHNRHKLQRGRRRFEREFVEQVRLASLLEHVCIVQFIGITLGSNNQSQQPEHSNLKWKMGVVFEYMHCGSLASIFHDERTRRDGKQFGRTITLTAPASTTTTPQSAKHDQGSSFSWYPSPHVSIVENGSTMLNAQRSKLSIALDVAMALSYLHSLGYAHNDLRAEKVLLNEQGEAKLSGMDIDLAVNVPEATPTRGDVRASAVKARIKVMHMFQTPSISQSPALGSSLLNSSSALVPTGGVATLGMSSLTSSTVLISANSRARRRGMHDDIYAFGLLLWELDTMMCVDAMKRLTTASTEIGAEHHMLRFSTECPSEIQYLARRCWLPERKDRPTALDLQEEIVRLLEGRLTTLSERSRSTHRWSRRTNSRNGSSSFASSHSSLSRSDYRSSSLVISETEV